MRQLAVPTPYVIGDIKVYSCELNGELILFDTGPMTADALSYLEKRVNLDRLKYVFITHWHPEHCGLAALLEERTPAEIVLSKHEAYRLKGIKNYFKQLALLLACLGFPGNEIERLVNHLRVLNEGIPMPDNVVLLEESEGLLDALGIQYFYCPFHSARDVVYLVGNYALSGDIVLKDIYSSPCIEPDPVSPSERFDNYYALCAAISQLKGIEKYKLLPSHWEPVESIDNWIDFMAAKLVERTCAVAPLLLDGNTVYQTTVKHFGERIRRNPLYFYIKASEVNLSREFLEAPQLLVEALHNNGLMTRMDDLFQHQWIQGSLTSN